VELVGFDKESGAGVLIVKMSKEVVIGTVFLLHSFVCMQDVHVPTTYYTV
jgi:hypothetical protein